MTIVKFDSEPGVYKTCDQNQLEFFTSAGWQLVAMYTVESALAVPEQQIGQGNGYTRTMQTTRAMPYTNICFVVRKGEQSALADAQKEALAAQEARDKAVQEHDDTKKAYKQSEQEVARLKQAVETRELALKVARADKEHIQTCYTKMEQGLAKIRNAIGELKMKEILADASR